MVRKTDDNIILQMLREGKSQRQIAEHFDVSQPAISKRVKKLLDKKPESFERLTPKNVLKRTNRNGKKGVSLVVSDRKEHCQTLYDLIEGKRPAKILTGDVSSGKRKEIVEKLNQGSIKVLIATSQLIGEGFDLKSLSSIHLATPIKFTGRVKQYTGRILRTARGKREAVIYDYLDRPGVLQASFESRTYAYKELGVEQRKLDS